MKPEIIIIGGPTASGKSQIALDLAKKLGGEIINADSMQMYARLHVLTARPGACDLALVPHHLYGVLEGQDWGSVGSWTQAAVDIIRDVLTRGKVPIVVGGTGMYLKALTEGLSPVPEIPAEIREQARELAATHTAEEFYELVLYHDPAIKGVVRPSDTQRLTRALEVVLATGESIRSFQGNAQKLEDFSYDYRVIMPPREELYDRINLRVHHMVTGGALEEVRALRDQKLPSDHPVMKALGVAEFSAHLAGELDLEAAIKSIQQGTRHYAKRQMTWFRRIEASPSSSPTPD